MMVASSVAGLGDLSLSPAVAPETRSTESFGQVVRVQQTLPAENKKAAIERTMTVEEYVRSYFSDIPIMIEVAKCESRFRQYDKNGEVLRGEQNSLDRGVMQINEYYHNEDSDKLGYDILTLEGNTAYARYLFEKYGVQPWAPSSRCWGSTLAYSEYSQLASK